MGKEGGLRADLSSERDANCIAGKIVFSLPSVPTVADQTIVLSVSWRVFFSSIFHTVWETASLDSFT